MRTTRLGRTAARAAMRMPDLSSNAFAAVARGFTLQDVKPHLNGPGGDMPVIFRDARARRVRVFGGEGPAPAAAIEACRALGLEAIPDDSLLPADLPDGVDARLLLLLLELGTRDSATVP